MRSDKEKQSLKLVSELLTQQIPGCVIKESKDQFAHYDLLLELNAAKAYIEVKERMGKYCEVNSFVKFSELGWMSEQVKWDFLVGKTSRYINLFRVDGKIIIMVWNLNAIQSNTTVLNCPKATDESFGRIGNMDKITTNLRAEQGIIYVKRDTAFEKID
jgi:hypothetical protein